MKEKEQAGGCRKKEIEQAKKGKKIKDDIKQQEKMMQRRHTGKN